MPKYKIKKSTPFTEATIEGGTKKLEKAKMPKEMFKKPKKGKIILRKKRQNVKEGETNLMDERAITEAEAKRLLEKKRLKRELKINKMIEGL